MNVSIKSKIAEIAKHGVVYGLTSSLQNVLTFLLLPVLTNYLKPADFGIYSIIILTTALAGAIFSFGAPSALGRFYFEEDTDLFRSQLVSMTLLISILGSVILVVGALIFSANISIWLFDTPTYRLHIVLALAAAAFIFLLNIMTLVLRYEKRSLLFMIIMIANVIINFCATYFLLTKYQLGILAPLYGLMISNCACFLFLFIRYASKITLNLNTDHFSMLMSFGLQASITGLLFYLLDWIDRLILKEFVSMSDVGIYSLGYRLGAILNVLLITPFGLIWAPIRMQYANSKDNQQFVSQTFSYFSIIGFMLIMVATLFGADAMHFFFKNNEYYHAVKVFPVIMLAILFLGFQSILDYGIYLHKKVHYYIIIAIVALIFNVVFNYILIPHFGIIASAYVTLFTYVLSTSLIYFFSNKYYRINIEFERILIPLAVVIACNCLSDTGFLPRLLVAIAIIACFFKFWFNGNEKAFLINKIPKAFKQK